MIVGVNNIEKNRTKNTALWDTLSERRSERSGTAMKCYLSVNKERAVPKMPAAARQEIGISWHTVSKAVLKSGIMRMVGQSESADRRRCPVV